MASDIPRTDKAAFPPPEALVTADFARKLEREVARLTAEVAALKAHDPLAEMWRELSDYQPFADRDGHGGSWRRMCAQRTDEAAWAASRVASRAARYASRAARYAARASRHAVVAVRAATLDAACAVGDIRRAKEVQP